MNEELIMKVANLISEGKGELLEEAIRKMSDSSDSMPSAPVTNETSGRAMIDDGPENWDNFGDGHNEDDNDENIGRCDFTNFINSLQPMASVVPNSILVLPIPTVYGVAMFVDMSKYNYSITRLNALLNNEYTALPVSIDTIMYDDYNKNEVFVYSPELNDKVVKYALIIPTQYVNHQVGYTFPIKIDGYHGMGGVATDPVDMVNSVLAIYQNIDNPIILPTIGYKVTKPDFTCKGKDYDVGQYYTTDEDVVMHHNGFHFALQPDTLKTWYRGPYQDNIPWLVQSGPYVEEKNGIAVSDGILFIKELDWNNLV